MVRSSKHALGAVLVSAVFAIGMGATARATPITILNSDFGSPGVGPPWVGAGQENSGSVGASTITDWAQFGQGASYSAVVNPINVFPNNFGFFTATPPVGSQAAETVTASSNIVNGQIDFAGIAQSLGALTAGAKITVSVSVASQLYNPTGTFFIGLGYDPTGIYGQGSFFDSITGTPTPGAWTTESLTGKYLGATTPNGFYYLVLSSFGPSETTYWNNVVASYQPGVSAPPVPEASTWAMMVFGFLGVGFLAYRRKGHSSFRAA